MTTQLGEAQVPIRATLDKLDGDLAKARSKIGGAVDGIISNVQKVGGVALGIGGLAAGAFAGVGAALAKMAIDAAPVEGIERAFEGLAESSGQSADAMIEALQRGSAGMIAQRDLMESYNKAAQLVGTTFANQLPDAMGYLGKVSAATGQDMGFMLDSLVTGVGRLSPMILDNLGIQVNMTEAAEAWAKASGMAAGAVIDNTKAMAKEEAELAKLGQQLVVAKTKQAEFGANTKESTRLAMGFKIEELTAKMAEHRAELGQLSAANGTVSTSTDDLIENMSKAQQQEALMAQVMEKLATNTAAMPEVLGSASTRMAAFQAKIQDTKDSIGMALLPALGEVVGGFSSLVDLVLPHVTDFFETTLLPIIDKVGHGFDVFVYGLKNGKDPIEAIRSALKEMGLAEVGDAIGVVVAKIQELWARIQPLIETVAGWIQQNVQLKDVLIAVGIAIATFVAIALWPIIQTVLVVIATTVALIAIVTLLRKAWESDFLGIRTALTGAWEKIKPVLEMLWEWLKVNIPAAIDVLVGFWEETLLPAIKAVWEFVDTYLIPILEALREVVGAALVLAGTALAGLWQNKLLPALKAAGGWISDKLGPILDKFVGWLNKVTGGAEGVKRALQSVRDWIQRVADKISSIKLPSWLTPGSPTPFEIGLVGIADAARRLARIELPQIAASLSMPQFVMAGAGPGQAVATPRGNAGTFTQILHFGTDSVRSEEDIYRLAEQTAHSLELRGLQRMIG